MKSKILLSVLALGLAGMAQAHHSGSVYDNSKTQVWTGTLSKVEWIAPHILVHLDVKGPDGKVTDWVYEGLPPAWYRHHNYKRADFEKGLGQTVKIKGAPARSGIPLASLNSMEFSDGTQLSLFGAVPPPEAAK